MPTKKNPSDAYDRLAESLAAGRVGNFYIFHGEERYLLERRLGQLRQLLCPGGLDGFNYRRFEGKNLPVDEIEDAIDTFPFFAERSLIEVHDFDIFKSAERERLAEIFSDLPGYACVVFVYGVTPYKPDGRQKLNAAILKNADVVEFVVQDQGKLVKWIWKHFHAAGKRISASDAEYLAFITGGYMSTLHGEIEKAAAYARGDAVTRADIDAVVTPVLDTVVYKLTDALARREHAGAMRLLDELLQMREAPHKLLYSISLKMRQLLAARVCIESGLGKKDLMEMCAIRLDFVARSLMDTARRMTLGSCRSAVMHCADTAYELNSAAEPESRLTELIVKLAFTDGK